MMQNRSEQGNLIKKLFFVGSDNYEAGFFKVLTIAIQPPISNNTLGYLQSGRFYLLFHGCGTSTCCC
jgi:hypothetical protein